MGRNAPVENAASFEPGADDVFARISARYDLLCDIFSLFLHRGWKAKTARFIASQNPRTFLDGASGTGHIALRVKKRMERGKYKNPLCKIIASDISRPMLEIARARSNRLEPKINFQIMDAHNFKGIKPNSVDVISVSLAMKICDRDKVIRAAFQCLKPGGTFVCLEASTISLKPVRWIYLKYMDWCLPFISRLAGGDDPSTYIYLLKGIHRFPDQETFAGELTRLGFERVGYKNMSFGIVAMHTGKKPVS